MHLPICGLGCLTHLHIRDTFAWWCQLLEGGQSEVNMLCPFFASGASIHHSDKYTLGGAVTD